MYRPIEFNVEVYYAFPVFMSTLLPPWLHASSSVHIIDSIHVTCLDVTCLIDESANPQERRQGKTRHRGKRGN
jgi:hypothetical protein